MNPEAWSAVLLVRACEEVDAEGTLLSVRERDRATRDAEDIEGDRLVRRAQALRRLVEERAPTVVSASRTVAAYSLPAWLPSLAFVLGALTDRFGNTRELNLLAFPLVGLLFWNAWAYASEVLRAVGVGAVLPDLVPLLRWARRAVSPLTKFAGADRSRDLAILERYVALVQSSTGVRQGFAVRRSLHLSAAAFASGVVASLYVAGLAFEYEATWESTFFAAEGARRVFVALLGPASALLGLPIPGVDAIASLEAPARGAAAPWIHRWAATVGLFVIVPRLVLAAVSELRARRASVDLGLGDPYYARLLASGRGGGRSVDVVSYSFAPDPVVRDQLQDLALELFGNRIRLEPSCMVRYGDPPPPLPAGDAEARILVFNFAQSPEQEVHGVFLASCLAALGTTGGARLLVAVDETGYRKTASPDRIEERRRAWARLLREERVIPVWLPNAPQAVFAAAQEALRAGAGEAVK